jgi:quinol-cytochrome oxidoreductase complex cytochrome b subunit
MVVPLLASLVIGDRSWIVPSITVSVLGVLLALWLNRRHLTSMPLGPILRIIGWLLLAVCLMNPLWSSSRPRSGANVVAVLADNSRSHLVQADSAAALARIFLQTL